MMMLFQVKEKYDRPGSPDVVIASFKNLNHAKIFVEAILREAERTSVFQVSYRLFEGMDLLEEFFPKKGGGASQSSSQQQTQSFSPTPFQTRPRPGGVPPTSFRDDDKDKNK